MKLVGLSAWMVTLIPGCLSRTRRRVQLRETGLSTLLPRTVTGGDSWPSRACLSGLYSSSFGSTATPASFPVLTPYHRHSALSTAGASHITTPCVLRRTSACAPSLQSTCWLSRRHAPSGTCLMCLPPPATVTSPELAEDLARVAAGRTHPCARRHATYPTRRKESTPLASPSPIATDLAGECGQEARAYLL